MNLAIYKPKKDQCKTCVAFQNKSPNNEEKKQQEKHLKKRNDACKVRGKIKLETKRDPDLEANEIGIGLIRFSEKKNNMQRNLL